MVGGIEALKHVQKNAYIDRTNERTKNQFKFKQFTSDEEMVTR